MRRLLYLALALVLLALTGLAFVRVTNSPAYVARARLMRIQPDMKRADVVGIMGEPSASQGILGGRLQIDFWEIDEGHTLWVYYPKTRDPMKVASALIVLSPEESWLDMTLDLLGYPRLKGEPPSQSHSF